jgi:hypothetical protein
VNTRSPFRCTSKMPFSPGTTSTMPISSSHSSRMRAARPTAFGRAPQGTQYSIRKWWRSPIGSIQPRGVHPPSPSGLLDRLLEGWSTTSADWPPVEDQEVGWGARAGQSDGLNARSSGPWSRSQVR